MYEKIAIACDLFLKEAKKKKPWTDKPEGWTGKSVKQYSKSMMKGEEHPFTECTKKMKGKVDDPKKFCGSVKGIFNKTKKKKGKGKKSKK